jgi:hypothetical protein
MTVEEIITKLKAMRQPEQNSSYVDQDSYCIGFDDGFNAGIANALSLLEKLDKRSGNTPREKQEVKR